jgi:hypothetical protein
LAIYGVVCSANFAPLILNLTEFTTVAHLEGL